MTSDGLTAIVLVSSTRALDRLCGISLLERHLRVLARIPGIERAWIVNVAVIDPARLPREPTPARPRLQLEVLDAVAARRVLETVRLYPVVIAETVIDRRILIALVSSTRPAVALEDRPPANLARFPGAGPGACPGAALVSGALVLELLSGTSLVELAALPGVEHVLLTAIDPYELHMRREIEVYAFPAPATPAAQAQAREVIFDAAQNGGLDLVDRHLDTPIASAIARKLCTLPVTPNQITLGCALVSAAVAWSFFTGAIVRALLLACVVAILDSLDGKQARIKVETSPLGELEHLLDYALETSWWAGLAWHLSSPWLLAGFWASDLLHRFGSGFFRARKGRLIDDWRPYDRLLRTIGGRRTIYIWILIVSMATGLGPATGFRAVVAWAFLCMASRWTRIAMIFARNESPSPRGRARPA